MYDQKDVDIVAQAIDGVAPNNPMGRGRLIVEAAMVAGMWPAEMQRALDWYVTHKLNREKDQ